MKIWIPPTGWLVALTLGASAIAEVAPVPVANEYLVYVASEAADKISLVRFNRDGGRLDRDWTTGIMPTDGPPTCLAVLSEFNPKVKGKSIDLSKTYTNDFVQAASAVG